MNTIPKKFTFKHEWHLDPEIYLAVLDQDDVIISWIEDGLTKTTTYTVDSVFHYIKAGTWIVLAISEY